MRSDWTQHTTTLTCDIDGCEELVEITYDFREGEEPEIHGALEDCRPGSPGDADIIEVWVLGDDEQRVELLNEADLDDPDNVIECLIDLHN